MQLQVRWTRGTAAARQVSRLGGDGSSRVPLSRASALHFAVSVVACRYRENRQTNMSRAQRQLSLPEELERLEQQITLTLQEIDSNFSKAHRIVTGSILPIVEQYAKHSNDVWEGSKVGYGGVEDGFNPR